MHPLRLALSFVGLLSSIALLVPIEVHAQAVDARADAETGVVHLLLFGPGDRPLEGVTVELAGARQSTNGEGAAHLRAPEGTQRLRLRVPRSHVPEAPIDGDVWVVDLPDIPLVASETTEVIATLAASGAIMALDVQAPEAGGGARSMQKEFERALAEKPLGSLRATVVAAEGGAPVAGARAYVRGAPLDALSDAEGVFTLKLPAGTYALSVIHPKYSTQGVPDVVIAPGGEKTLRIELSPASVELDELVVTAPHIEGGVASLIAERRETTAVADVIGAEQMARSGDSSAASALARVTGLTVVDGRFVIVRGLGERYSSMTLNRLQVPSPEPTRRVVPLDLFPTGVLESVVVQKTYSPDLPGEFGGGLVQVRSRGYPEEFIFNLSLSSSYNTQTHLRENLDYEGGKRDYLGVDDGSRELPEGIRESGRLRLRNLFSREGEDYTAEQLEAFGESLSNEYDTKRSLTPPDLGVVASVGNRFALRHAKIGFVSALGYKNEYAAVRDAVSRNVQGNAGSLIGDDFRLTTAGRQVSLSGFLDWGVEFSEKQKLKFTTMVLRQTDDTTTLRRGFDVDAQTDTRATRLSWVERQVALQQVSGSHGFDKLNELTVDWRYAFARSGRYEPDRRDYEYSRAAGTGMFQLVSGGSTQRLWGDLNDTTHEGQLDLALPIDIWSKLTAKIKAGALVYERRRDAWVRRFEYLVSGLSPDMLTLSPSQIFTPENIGPRAQFREVSRQNDTYDASMALRAGYLMLELPLVEQVELMAGARVEKARIQVTTFDPYAAMSTPERAKLDNVDVLPAGTLTYRFIEDWQLRAGYSRTLNRPDLRELSSSQYDDIEANAVLRGSADLKRATIDSYDLRLEWYFTSDEVFSVGGFYKQFDDPIELSVQPGAEIIYTFANTDSARSLGLELDARKRFDFIAPSLDELYLAGNFAWIDSEVGIDLVNGGTYKRPLQSQSPWVLNLQLGWDDSDKGGTGTSASLLYNVAGRRIRAVSNPNLSIPEQYEEPLHRLDFVFSQSLPHGFKLGVRAQNILNAEQVWKQGDIVVRRFRRGADISASLAWSY